MEEYFQGELASLLMVLFPRKVLQFFSQESFQALEEGMGVLEEMAEVEVEAMLAVVVAGALEETQALLDLELEVEMLKGHQMEEVKLPPSLTF